MGDGQGSLKGKDQDVKGVVLLQVDNRCKPKIIKIITNNHNAQKKSSLTVETIRLQNFSI